ncbi:MAG TPA: thylakoid-associated protein, partial [Planktothrix sp. UBA8407]|nr:thylakoid-associated protein [Planktothrix sp. UBA8402]HAO09869.1 thylakoid-associated protein [Planktothrix sp. UBA8407]
MMSDLDTRNLEKLASEIGENIYIDIAKWHLYLSEAHLHTQLAEQFYPLLKQGECTEIEVQHILQKVYVNLGEGKQTISLVNLIPNSVIQELIKILKDFQEDL